VPKRGYKLVANVQRLDSNPYLSARQEETLPSEPPSEPDAPEADEPVAEIVFPAGPLTRAVCHSQQPKKTSQPNVSRWRLNLLNALWIGLVIVAMGFFTIKQSQVRITQVVDTHLIEFKFQDDFDSKALSHDLADGVAQKLMADITQVSDYRVMLSKTAFTSGILPGKSVTVRVNDKEGHSFLDLELKNNSSDAILFSRQYPLDSQHLATVLKNAEL
ncbi:transcriptional regulator CadC, partial [Vibrio cholerae]|nr:transcriptional regulator CadC [Vibrio cholerae]